MQKKELSKLKNIYEKIMDIVMDEKDFLEGNLIEKYKIDSLVALQIIVEIEKAFQYVIEEDDVAIKIVDSPSFFLRLYKK